MKTKIFSIWIILLLFAFLGCDTGKNKEPPNAIKNETIKMQKRAIVVAIDYSGSYELLNQAKAMLCWIIKRLNPGDILYCRAITASSYPDNCTIFKLELPVLKEYREDNPFDKRLKNIRSKELFQINMLKKEACSKLSVSQPIPKAMKTDVYGFLAAASDKFVLIPPDYQRILIISSDLQDNIGYKVKPQLSKVKIAITGFQNSKDPSKTLKLKNQWVKYFTEAGGSKVIFLSIEDSFTMEHFLGRRQ
jgi:hypothetical protein